MPMFVPQWFVSESCFLHMKVAALEFAIPVLPPNSPYGQPWDLSVFANSLCLMCRPCGADIFSAGYQSGLLIWSPTLEPNMDGIAFSEAVRHMKKLWQAKGDLLQTANGWCLNRDDCHITHDWQPIWNFISNKPGNFCRVAGVRLLSKELASFPGKT